MVSVGEGSNAVISISFITSTLTPYYYKVPEEMEKSEIAGF